MVGAELCDAYRLSSLFCLEPRFLHRCLQLVKYSLLSAVQHLLCRLRFLQPTVHHGSTCFFWDVAFSYYHSMILYIFALFCVLRSCEYEHKKNVKNFPVVILLARLIKL